MECDESTNGVYIGPEFSGDHRERYDAVVVGLSDLCIKLSEFEREMNDLQSFEANTSTRDKFYELLTRINCARRVLI